MVDAMGGVGGCTEGEAQREGTDRGTDDNAREQRECVRQRHVHVLISRGPGVVQIVADRHCRR